MQNYLFMFDPSLDTTSVGQPSTIFNIMIDGGICGLF